MRIRAAADGHALVAPALTRRLIERFASSRPRAAPELGRFTEREREVLILLIRGLSNAEIASHLFVGESTRPGELGQAILASVGPA